MIQGGKRLGFALKTREAFGVVCEHFGQDLDRDVAVELRVASSPNLAHTAWAEGRNDFVGSESNAESERQLWRIAGLVSAKSQGWDRSMSIFVFLPKNSASFRTICGMPLMQQWQQMQLVRPAGGIRIGLAEYRAWAGSIFSPGWWRAAGVVEALRHGAAAMEAGAYSSTVARPFNERVSTFATTS
jgi:hypothetical protein